MFQNILDDTNKKVIFLGNEAIVRGALEAGVQFVSTYPGTPASEIGNSFFELKKQKTKIAENFYFEFSTNEKTALEAGAGACFSGLRTLVAMKNFGLNVASDFLFPLVYSGVKTGMVIIIADDPQCWSSAQSEENTRGFARLMNIPILEPSDAQECLDFTKYAFEMSEKFKIPVIVRETTRIAHQSAPVKMSKIIKTKNRAKFIRDKHQLVTMPPRVLEMHKELLEKMDRIKEFSEKSLLNFIEQPQAKQKFSKIGIITSSVSYLHTMEAIKELNISLPILKLGFFHPLPEEKIKKFIKNLDKVLIIEELDPFLEREIKILAKDANNNLKIIGKELLTEVGELKPEIVIQAIAKFVDIKIPLDLVKKTKTSIKRFPQLCAGCPYWFVFNGVKKACENKDVIFGGDIGCYMLAGFPPHNMQDYLYCMSSSIGIAHGIKKAYEQNLGKNKEQKIVAFIGDSTFFHSGISALINVVFNKSNPLIIIMDNSTTAMTGHQPHPSAPFEPNGLHIENIVSALGIKNLKIIDPAKQDEFIKTIKDFLNKKQVSVIIARRPCRFVR